MKRFQTFVGLGLGLALACASCKSANQEPGKEAAEANEVKMRLDQTPPAVRDSLAREAGSATIGDVDKSAADGQTIYETDVMLNGTNYEIKVDEAGKLISKKIDDESSEKKGDEKKGGEKEEAK